MPIGGGDCVDEEKEIRYAAVRDIHDILSTVSLVVSLSDHPSVSPQSYLPCFCRKLPRTLFGFLILIQRSSFFLTR